MGQAKNTKTKKLEIDVRKEQRLDESCSPKEDFEEEGTVDTTKSHKRQPHSISPGKESDGDDVNKDDDNDINEGCDSIINKSQPNQKMGQAKNTKTKKLEIDIRKEQQWEESFQSLKNYKLQQGDCIVRISQDRRLHNWIRAQRKSKTMSHSKRKRLESIGFLWDNSAEANAIKEKKWEEMFQHLKRYKMKHGHCVVPRRYEEDVKLGRWVQYQKERKMRMSDDRKQRLDSIGFVWAVREKNQSPKQEKTVEKSRKKREDCISSDLTTNNVGLADEGALSSSPSSSLTTTTGQTRKQSDDKQQEEHEWEKLFKQLQVYQLQHGDCRVSGAQDPELYGWITTQRNKKKTQTLSASRMQRLESIGLVWNMELEEKWDNMFQKLQDYKRKCGDCDVQTSQNATLSNWVKEQRCERKKLDLSASRIYRLDSIGFVWERQENGTHPSSTSAPPLLKIDPTLPKDDTIDDGDKIRISSCQGSCFGSPERIKGRNNDNPTSEAGVSSSSLCRKESAYKKNLQQQWDQMFECLKTYKQKHGDCHVKSGDSKNTTLRLWTKRQRGLKRSGKLSAPRGRQLDSIAFRWNLKGNDKLEQHWNEMFENLQNYKLKYGTCNVQTPKDKKLHVWIYDQITKYEMGELSASRSERLKSIGILGDGKNDTEKSLDKTDHNIAHSDHDDDSDKESIVMNDDSLKDDRVHLLQEKKGRIKQSEWNMMFKRLRKFKRKHGNCLVPSTYESDPDLAKWVKTQRILWKNRTEKKKLQGSNDCKTNNAIRMKRLESIDFSLEHTDNDEGDDNNDEQVVHMIPAVCERERNSDDDYSTLTASVGFSASVSSVGSTRVSKSRKRSRENILQADSLSPPPKRSSKRNKSTKREGSTIISMDHS